MHSKPKAKTCCYCMKKGHTSYIRYVKRFDVPRSKCVWILKDLTVEINEKDDGTHKPREGVNWFLKKNRLLKLELKETSFARIVSKNLVNQHLTNHPLHKNLC